MHVYFQNHWKLLIIVTVIEAYYIWIEDLASPIYTSEPFVAETGFYFCLLNIILGNIVLFSLVKLMTPNINNLLLWKSITLALCSKFLYLPITIWKENLTKTNTTLHILLMNAHFLLALMQIYLALTLNTRAKTVLIILFAFISKSVIMFALSIESTLQTYDNKL